MKIFITGSTGFIGSHFLAALIEKYGNVAKMLCYVREIPKNRLKSVEYIQGRLEEIAKHEAVLVECDYVFHVAANAGYGNDADYDAVNLEPTRELIGCLKHGRIRNFVFLSSIGAVDRVNPDRCAGPITVRSRARPRSAYGRSKLKAEECIRSSGVPFTVIRPAWVYGRGMRTDSHVQAFVTMIAKGSGVYKMNFPGRVSIIHVSDLVQSMVNAVGNDDIIGNTYFAATETRSIGEMLRLIAAKVLKKEVSQFSIPSFRFLMSRIHAFLPLSICNLFINYLCASDPRYRADFHLGEHMVFEKGVEDVLADNTEFNGTWVITGANSGIGFSLAQRLDSKGEKLFLVDKNTENIRANFPDSRYLQTDLSRENEINRLIENLENIKIKVLVNNAGVGFRGGVQSLSEQQILSITDVNIKAPLLITKGLLKQLRKSRSSIVNVASSVAYAPLPFMSVYASSKAFMANWSESLTYELKETNKVITVLPSGTFTQFQKSAGVKVSSDGKGLLSPEYVAKKIETAVKKGQAMVFPGWKTKTLLAATSILPKSKRVHIWGKLFETLR